VRCEGNGVRVCRVSDDARLAGAAIEIRKAENWLLLDDPHDSGKIAEDGSAFLFSSLNPPGRRTRSGNEQPSRTRGGGLELPMGCVLLDYENILKDAQRRDCSSARKEVSMQDESRTYLRMPDVFAARTPISSISTRVCAPRAFVDRGQ